MGETTVAYAMRLQEKAHDCDFGSNHDEDTGTLDPNN